MHINLNTADGSKSLRQLKDMDTGSAIDLGWPFFSDDADF
jgi:hypothetical protein